MESDPWLESLEQIQEPTLLKPKTVVFRPKQVDGIVYIGEKKDHHSDDEMDDQPIPDFLVKPLFESTNQTLSPNDALLFDPCEDEQNEAACSSDNEIKCPKCLNTVAIGDEKHKITKV